MVCELAGSTECQQIRGQVSVSINGAPSMATQGYAHSVRKKSFCQNFFFCRQKRTHGSSSTRSWQKLFSMNVSTFVPISAATNVWGRQLNDGRRFYEHKLLKNNVLGHFLFVWPGLVPGIRLAETVVTWLLRAACFGALPAKPFGTPRGQLNTLKSFPQSWILGAFRPWRKGKVAIFSGLLPDKKCPWGLHFPLFSWPRYLKPCL